MKRFFSIIFSLIIVLSVSLFGCSGYSYGEPCKNDEHDYAGWVYQNDATCYDDGTEVAVCKNPYCSAKLVRIKEGTKLTHNIEFIDVLEPTCYSIGCSISYYHCTHCEDNFSDENANSKISNLSPYLIDKVGHVYEDEWTIDKKPTKTERGEQSKHCVNYEHCKARDQVESIASITEGPGWTPNM